MWRSSGENGDVGGRWWTELNAESATKIITQYINFNEKQTVESTWTRSITFNRINKGHEGHRRQVNSVNRSTAGYL